MMTALIACGCGAAGSRRLSFERVPSPPFGVSITRDDRYAFVDLINGRVQVYSLSGARPRLLRTIAVPGEAVGSSLTRDGQLLLIADGEGAAVIDVARAESGAPHSVLGVLRPPASAKLRAAGAIEVSSSASGGYVFVSLEYGSPDGAVAIYRIGEDRHPRFGTADWVGSIPLGQAVVGSALSPDGQRLYVTSELAASAGRGPAAFKSDGSLTVIDVARAEHAPRRAILATVAAGRQPVRDVVSPNGSTVWVTARASNKLLAFSAQRLVSDPSKALTATVRVGTAPVGVALFDGGHRALVADSDRFNAPGAHAALTVIDTENPAHPTTTATLRADGFPREIAIDPRTDSALVTNFSSEQLEVVPLPPGR